jgi:hypothetical protein
MVSKTNVPKRVPTGDENDPRGRTSGVISAGSGDKIRTCDLWVMSEPVAVSLDTLGLIPTGQPAFHRPTCLARSHLFASVAPRSVPKSVPNMANRSLSRPRRLRTSGGRFNTPTTGPDASDTPLQSVKIRTVSVDDFKSPRSRFSRCEECEPATFRFSDGRAALPEPFVLIRPDPSWRIRRVGSTGPTRWPHIGPTVLARVQQISVRNSAPVQPKSHSLPCVHQTGSNPPPRRQLSGMARDGRLEV